MKLESEYAERYPIICSNCNNEISITDKPIGITVTSKKDNKTYQHLDIQDCNKKE